jgi:ATP-dependent RNA circularization protein (DNA/RNA ligase family)
MEYVSDKKAIERAFILFQLQIISLEALTGDNHPVADKVRNAFYEACQHKDKSKMIRRCDRLSVAVMKPVLENQEKINGHKFILMLHALAQRIIDSGYIFPKFVTDAFEPFFEIEANQKIENDDWVALKNSAQKAARKLHERLLGEGYYQT